MSIIITTHIDNIGTTLYNIYIYKYIFPTVLSLEVGIGCERSAVAGLTYDNLTYLYYYKVP
jgi:hypothetical protein